MLNAEWLEGTREKRVESFLETLRQIINEKRKTELVTLLTLVLKNIKLNLIIAYGDVV